MKNFNHQSRITIIPGLCGGKPTIRGMRITVSNILEMLAGGMSDEQILQDFPYLESEDITECLRFAARVSSYSLESSEATA
jgi:uncharacterized protein (DUF433 family)